MILRKSQTTEEISKLLRKQNTVNKILRSDLKDVHPAIRELQLNSLLEDNRSLERKKERKKKERITNY